MWCANCQADVAAEVAADNQTIHCATCRLTLQPGRVTRGGAAARNAQEILAKWSTARLLDPFGPPEKAAGLTPAKSGGSAADAHQDSRSEADVLHRGQTPSGRNFRVETAHGEQLPQSSEGHGSPLRHAHSSSHQAESSEPEQSDSGELKLHVDGVEAERRDEPHAAVRAPHWNVDVQEEVQMAPQPPANWSSVMSQLLAYCGVGGLTIGTACVIWGYFGNIPSYLPLGWMAVTFGQMLLFLGFVTMVSSGMESMQMELSQRLHRLERGFTSSSRSSQSSPNRAGQNQPAAGR